jgi:hypothetical protein
LGRFYCPGSPESPLFFEEALLGGPLSARLKVHFFCVGGAASRPCQAQARLSMEKGLGAAMGSLAGCLPLFFKKDILQAKPCPKEFRIFSHTFLKTQYPAR